MLFPSYRIREFSHLPDIWFLNKAVLFLRLLESPCSTKSSPERIPVLYRVFSKNQVQEIVSPLLHSWPSKKSHGRLQSPHPSAGTEQKRGTKKKKENTGRCKRRGRKTKVSKKELKAKLKIRHGDLTAEISPHTPTAHHNFSVSVFLPSTSSSFGGQRSFVRKHAAQLSSVHYASPQGEHSRSPWSVHVTRSFVRYSVLLPTIIRSYPVVRSKRILQNLADSKSSIKKSADQLTRRIRIKILQRFVRSNTPKTPTSFQDEKLKQAKPSTMIRQRRFQVSWQWRSPFSPFLLAALAFPELFKSTCRSGLGWWVGGESVAERNEMSHLVLFCAF